VDDTEKTLWISQGSGLKEQSVKHSAHYDSAGQVAEIQQQPMLFSPR
jgi:hypothetical protein